MRGFALWYSADDGGYYWQDGSGAGDWTSGVYRSIAAAKKAFREGKVQREHHNALSKK